MIRHSFCGTVEAKNGVEAWELWQKEHPDLVISDVVMPGMDGTPIIWSGKVRPPAAATFFPFP